jgi:hypothetical protein
MFSELCFVPCVLRHVSCVMFHVSCFMCPVPCVICPVRPISCAQYPVPRVLCAIALYSVFLFLCLCPIYVLWPMPCALSCVLCPVPSRVLRSPVSTIIPFYWSYSFPNSNGAERSRTFQVFFQHYIVSQKWYEMRARMHFVFSVKVLHRKCNRVISVQHLYIYL